MIGKRERGNLYTLSTQMNGVKEKISSRSKNGKKEKKSRQAKDSIRLNDKTTNDERTEEYK
jgi:hypothetical protein